MSWHWNQPTYISAAEKRRRSEKAANKLVEDGKENLLPIRIEGRLIANSFWGKSWCKNLESYSDYSNRLPRGRTYVRNGSVVDLQISARTVTALVSGSDLYEVSIKIERVKTAAWKALKSESSGQVGSLIDLLQGKLTAPVMEIMTRRENGLFPKPAEIQLRCSCPDSAKMCKHVAAVLYGVGARLDQTPELLFTLRGADHLELITEAAESVTTGAAVPAVDTIAVDALADVFGIEIDLADETPAPPEPARVRTKGPARKAGSSVKTANVPKTKRGKLPITAKPAARKKAKPAAKGKPARRPKARRN